MKSLELGWVQSLEIKTYLAKQGEANARMRYSYAKEQVNEDLYVLTEQMVVIAVSNLENREPASAGSYSEEGGMRL